jgi:hypothetical protein
VIPKRTLEELLLIYQTEWTLIDVFCEGPGDHAILKSFVDAIQRRRTAVFDADQIEWPDGLSNEGGNRSRIVFLSKELSSRALHGICVIDRDLDTIEDHTPGNGCLLKTDYSSLDMYGFDRDDVSTYIYSTFNVSLDAAQVDQILEACKRLFVIRFLRERHAVGSSIADARRIISDEKNCTVGVKEYLQRCKQLNGYDARWDIINELEDGVFNGVGGDIRDHINVHDLGDILASIIRAIKSRSVSIDPNFIAKHCAYVLLTSRNFGYPLFSELSRRLA